MSKIGSRIRKLRTGKNMTQEQLAQKLHVTRQAISNWENGKTQPDLDTLQQMAKALGVRAEELAYGERSTACGLPLQKEDNPMFDNVGQKIKGLAMVVTWGGVIISVVAGFVVQFPIGLLTITPIGCLGAWVTGLLLYGFGHLIVNSNESIELLRSMAGEMGAPVPPSPAAREPWKCAACGTYSPAREARCIQCDTPRSNSTNREQ